MHLKQLHTWTSEPILMVSLNPPNAQRAATACRPMACSFANFLPLLLPLSRILSAYLPNCGMYIKALDNTWGREGTEWTTQEDFSVCFSAQWRFYFKASCNCALVRIWKSAAHLFCSAGPYLSRVGFRCGQKTVQQSDDLRRHAVSHVAADEGPHWIWAVLEIEGFQSSFLLEISWNEHLKSFWKILILQLLLCHVHTASFRTDNHIYMREWVP